nr:amidohydrolase family protein [Leucobacter coleopterorum]
MLTDRGDFTQPTRVSWADGTFALGGDPQPTDLDGTGLWIIPGVVDAHLHAAWHEFAASDRESADPEHVRLATAAALARTLAAGVTSVRDAGGLTAAALRGVPGARGLVCSSRCLLLIVLRPTRPGVLLRLLSTHLRRGHGGSSLSQPRGSLPRHPPS